MSQHFGRNGGWSIGRTYSKSWADVSVCSIFFKWTLANVGEFDKRRINHWFLNRKGWLQTVGSPQSRIDRAEFSLATPIPDYSFKGLFGIERTLWVERKDWQATRTEGKSHEGIECRDAISCGPQLVVGHSIRILHVKSIVVTFSEYAVRASSYLLLLNEATFSSSSNIDNRPVQSKFQNFGKSSQPPWNEIVSNIPRKCSLGSVATTFLLEFFCKEQSELYMQINIGQLIREYIKSSINNKHIIYNTEFKFLCSMQLVSAT